MESTARTTKRPAVAQVVKDHPHRTELGSLCLDVVCRQARGRALFSGRKYMRARAREHHIPRKRAGTALGHVLDILERGPAEGTEAALITAFAVDALGRKLDETSDASIADEFVSLSNWLALATPYQPYQEMGALVSAHARGMLSDAIARSITCRDPGPRPSVMLRLEALHGLDGGSERLSELASELEDAVLAAAAAALSGERTSLTVPKARPVPVGCQGRIADASGVGVRRVLGWLTGWALLRWLGRGLLWAVGMRRTAGVWVEGSVVRTERVQSLLGRKVHVIDESLRGKDVRAAIREVRHVRWVVLLGALCLVGGVLGFVVSVDAALRGGGAEPLAWGLGALGVGAGLDLSFELVARMRGGRVWLEIVVPGRSPLRIAGVDASAAEKLMQALDAHREC